MRGIPLRGTRRFGAWRDIRTSLSRPLPASASSSRAARQLAIRGRGGIVQSFACCGITIVLNNAVVDQSYSHSRANETGVFR
jgi:hypothetical protein